MPCFGHFHVRPVIEPNSIPSLSGPSRDPSPSFSPLNLPHTSGSGLKGYRPRALKLCTFFFLPSSYFGFFFMPPKTPKKKTGDDAASDDA